ncbi:hypothetical protein D5S17_31425 [Pseudonocardiaceae bacterium YIM PH 21723]|nr:hypothetical protein D5S17_31425 [Pseudonocardiaceae bacterium YIM PH 21723]
MVKRSALVLVLTALAFAGTVAPAVASTEGPPPTKCITDVATQLQEYQTKLVEVVNSDAKPQEKAAELLKMSNQVSAFVGSQFDEGSCLSTLGVKASPDCAKALLKAQSAFTDNMADVMSTMDATKVQSALTELSSGMSTTLTTCATNLPIPTLPIGG